MCSQSVKFSQLENHCWQERATHHQQDKKEAKHRCCYHHHHPGGNLVRDTLRWIVAIAGLTEVGAHATAQDMPGKVHDQWLPQSTSLRRLAGMKAEETDGNEGDEMKKKQYSKRQKGKEEGGREATRAVLWSGSPSRLREAQSGCRKRPRRFHPATTLDSNCWFRRPVRCRRYVT